MHGVGRRWWVQTSLTLLPSSAFWIEFSRICRSSLLLLLSSKTPKLLHTKIGPLFSFLCSNSPLCRAIESSKQTRGRSSILLSTKSPNRPVKHTNPTHLDPDLFSGAYLPTTTGHLLATLSCIPSTTAAHSRKPHKLLGPDVLVLTFSNYLPSHLLQIILDLGKLGLVIPSLDLFPTIEKLPHVLHAVTSCAASCSLFLYFELTRIL